MYPCIQLLSAEGNDLQKFEGLLEAGSQYESGLAGKKSDKSK